ncbi:hypothetical protein VTL71DRAFT_11400 [Oculimacula yallundae]|uniref:Uncharacterized protein n=1 Tax=Oculimacula yallundae TaxID=86028 RepID=A0ABR4CQH0_9HELO
MQCEYPSNVDDKHITQLGPESYSQPAESPTEMTYSLFRFRFSTVYREMVDAAWDIGSDIDDLPYEVVLDFDKKLNIIDSDLEKSYASIGKSVLRCSRAINTPMDEQIPVTNRTSLVRQRDMMYFGLHTRYARLHRPYLARGAQDPKYSYSRMVCLRSARTVIELGKSLIGSSKELTSIKIWFVNHHVFVSTVILVMDYCFNREEPRAKERKEEILDCFRLLESNKEDTSTIASRGLAKLKSMLGEKNDATKRAALVADAIQHAQSSGASTIQSNRNQIPAPSLNIGQVPPPLGQAHFSNLDISSAQYQTIPFAGTSDFNTNLNSNLSVAAAEMQNTWPAYDYTSFDNINFDVDLDVSQFEVLFQGIDGTAYN